MKTEFIYIRDFCSSHQIAESFIYNLQEFELVELQLVDEQHVIRQEELPKIEKIVRLHKDLNINLEGLEAIYYLLERTQQLQEEIRFLKNRLHRYGNEN